MLMLVLSPPEGQGFVFLLLSHNKSKHVYFLVVFEVSSD